MRSRFLQGNSDLARIAPNILESITPPHLDVARATEIVRVLDEQMYGDKPIPIVQRKTGKNIRCGNPQTLGRSLVAPRSRRVGGTFRGEVSCKSPQN